MSLIRPSFTLPIALATLATASLVAACQSQFNMTGTPALAPQTQGTSVRALLAPGAAGTAVTIDNPGALPEAVRNANNLAVAFGTQVVRVTRNPGGYYTFTVPTQARMEPDVAGNWKVVFVMDERQSQIVTLQTGSPVQFANPPVLTDPAPAFIVRGLDVKLTANTPAGTDKYEFTWAYATTAQGPWQPIPGRGKVVTWTPPQQGNYYVKVDAVDRTTQLPYSTTTSSAAVFVTDGKDVVTTTPTSGSVDRGQPVTLNFNRPGGLVGTDLSYAWSYSASPQGPWSVISGSGDKVDWLPTGIGSYYVRTEVANRANGEINTFVTPDAVVFVNERTPIVTANPSSVQRGDRTELTMNLNLPGSGPVTWSYSRTGGGPTAQWTPLSGNGKTNKLVVNEAGSYTFRVDVPDAAGSVKTFITTDPVLSVSEGATPLITSEPVNAAIQRGGSVDLVLNARGVDEANYKFIWYVSTSPFAGWSALPIEKAEDLRKKTFHWRTEFTVRGTVVGQTPVGSYFVRVDATENNGPNTYTFTSATPVVTIQP